MKSNFLYLSAFLIFCFSVISCKKTDLTPQEKMPDSLLQNGASLFAGNAANLSSAVFENHDEDSIERITVLGARFTNPYLIPNMRQAYTNLGLSSTLATVTNLYVRFKPSSVDQLALLDSVMDAQNLEIFDTPVDYDVTYEGDYYQDPSIPEEEITWQYAVVPPNFIFPAGIQNETIAQIHIPGNNYTAVETEAENLAGIPVSFSAPVGAASAIVKPNSAGDCPPGYVWDPIARRCVLQGGGSGYPPPAADASVPAGNIYVHDTNLNTDPGVRIARVVARRWFKIERVYTNNAGRFQFTKRFKHKVRINVKFKNDDAIVRGMRGVRLWQMLFAIKKTLGVFSGDKSNIVYTFIQYPNIDAKGTRYWAGATTHNAVQEYKDYATVESIGLPATRVKILLSNWGKGSASTPMFAKRFFNGLTTEFIFTFLADAIKPIVGGVAAVLAVLKHQVDMAVSYNVNISRLTSDFIKGTIYHELTHTAQFAALGNGWYSNFATAETNEIVNNIGSSYSPYGNGTNSGNSPIIALGESWAYYMGHYMADKTYGTNASCQSEQKGGFSWCNTSGTFHPHLDVEENFDPNLSSDPFKWIPQGLFYDLWDPANETLIAGKAVNDFVSDYTNAQMFGGFQSNIYTLQDYRIRLLQQTTNSTSANVPDLFSQYHYQ